eukprot:GHRR01028914.1.p1 GENE.GHRR01028914.1~~GHRR01028914.1.p1  ORF type:complete len:188 (+),score=32.01 GHRR01028914.1:128-691(+)
MRCMLSRPALCGYSRHFRLLSSTGKLGTATPAAFPNRFRRGVQSHAVHMENKWWDKRTVAIVTGANKGIGYEIARLLAEAGMAVIATSRNEELGQAAVNKLKGLQSIGDSQLQYHQLDISNQASVDAFASWVRQQHGKVDILVNNAGRGAACLLVSIDCILIRFILLFGAISPPDTPGCCNADSTGH